METLLKNKSFGQFMTYVLVGGIAAIVEWISFFIFNKMFIIHFALATVLSFFISTYTNWILGRKITFKDSCNKQKKLKEIIGIYIVSGIGLLCNVILMFIFVDKLIINSMIAKIASTGIVFFWNFLSRKLFIYKI